MVAKVCARFLKPLLIEKCSHDSGKLHPSFPLLGGSFPLVMRAFPPAKALLVYVFWLLFPAPLLTCVQSVRESTDLEDIALAWEPLTHMLPDCWPWISYLASLELMDSSSPNWHKAISVAIISQIRYKIQNVYKNILSTLHRTYVRVIVIVMIIPDIYFFMGWAVFWKCLVAIPQCGEGGMERVGAELQRAMQHAHEWNREQRVSINSGACLQGNILIFICDGWFELFYDSKIYSHRNILESHTLTHFCLLGGQFPVIMTPFLHKSIVFSLFWPLFPILCFGVSLDWWK